MGIRSLRRRLPEEALAVLAREVITRLAAHPAAVVASVDFPTDADIEELSRALLAKDATAGSAFIARVRGEGASLETVYLAYLRRAALQLGTWWEEDRITFADVTVGTGHIFSIMRGLSHLFVPRTSPRLDKTAFFASVPMETHVLGVRMAADLFRKDGWTVTLETDLSHDQIISRIVDEGHDLIGLSAAGEHAISALAQMIVALRISAPQARIFVGGNVIETSEKVVAMMGPDGMAADFDDARDEINRLRSEMMA